MSRRRKFTRTATSAPRPDELRQGVRVKVAGSCGTMDAGDGVPSAECRGLTGKVIGVNPTFEGEGGEMKASVQLDGTGGVVGIPIRNLRKTEGRVTGSAPTYAPGQFEEIFGDAVHRSD